MIKIENTTVAGLEAAVRGMRNPMNSWNKSDSDGGRVGVEDWALMMRLVKGGTSHRKFMRYITVTMDVTAPLYWWKEFDTYKVGTVANSCSTMHKITSKPFELDDFSHEHLFLDTHSDAYYKMREEEEEARMFFRVVDGDIMLSTLIIQLNNYRELFNKTKNKFWWWQIIQLLPTSYNQKRTILLNYEVLRRMYHDRYNHKLDCWLDFCEWIKTLPYAEGLIYDVD